MRQILQDFLVSMIAVREAKRSKDATAQAVLDRQTIATVSPAAYGSLGDEALMMGAFHCNTRSGYRSLMLTDGDANPWPVDVHAKSMDGSSLRAQFVWGDQWLVGMSRPHKVVVVGADSVDGVYGLRSLSQRVTLLNRHLASGGRAYLSNFSMRVEPSPDAVRILRALDPAVTLEARDVESQKRAMRYLDREVSVAPDIAQFLAPKVSAAVIRVREIFQKWRDCDLKVVVIVPNAHLGSLYGSPEIVERRFTEFTQLMLEAGFGCAVVSHDIREDPGDPDLCRRIVSNFGPEQAVRSVIPQSASEAKAIIGEADLCVTARMHAAVSGLSQDVATLGLDYVDKFIGQFAWYGQELNVIDRSVLNEPETLARTSILTFEAGAGRKAAEVRALLPSWVSE